MKQKLCFNMVAYFVFVFILSCLFASISFVEAKPTHSERVSGGKILFDSEIQVFETLECGEEKEIPGNDNDSKLYTKTVGLTKQFKKRTRENVYETKAEIRQSFTFTYDKKAYAEISPENISSEPTVTSWKISPLSRISLDDGMCSVSNQYRAYDKNFVGNYQYMCDGFVDIFCDFNGEIGINSDIR